MSGKPKSTKSTKINKIDKNILLKLKSFDTFIDLSSHPDNKRILELYKPSNRILAEISLIDMLFNTEDINIYNVGFFTISRSMYHSGSIVIVNQIDDSYYLQFDSLPRFLWYEIKSSDDLDRFSEIYMQDKSKKEKKHIRYELLRFKNIHPIVLERYMSINPFVDNLVYGPVIHDAMNDTMEPNNSDILIKSSSIDLSLKFSLLLEQYENNFMLYVTSRYSKIKIGVQITIAGTIIDMEYIPDTTYCNVIRTINKYLHIDLHDDMPIDLVLFLMSLDPASQSYHSHIMQLDNEQNISDDMISVFYRLNVGIMDHMDLIQRLIQIYDKLQIQLKKNKSNDLKNANDLKNSNDSQNQIQLEYMIDIVNNYITREYVDQISESDSNISSDIIIKKMKSNNHTKYINYKFLQARFN
jgi:hypothetical protein